MRNFIKNNTKIIFFIVLVIILTAVGVTLAYTANDIGVNIEGGDYNVIYDGSYALPSTSLSPVADEQIIDNEDKVLKIEFSVKGASTNPNDKNIIYDVSLTNLNFPKELQSRSLKWRLYKNGTQISEGTFSKEFDAQVDNRMVLTDTQQKLPSYSSTADSYVFYIWISISESCANDITACTDEEDVTTLMNQQFSGEIRIELSTGTPKMLNRVIGEAGATLLKLGLYDTVNEEIPAFNNISTLASGIYKTEDDLGTTYYFRGNVNNNYIKFGQDSSGNNMYWRILRINGDGTIRIMYDGTSAYINNVQTADRVEGTKKWNSMHTDNAFAGYMYGLTGIESGLQERCLTYDSSSNSAVDSISIYSTKESCETAGGIWTITAYEATHANIVDSTMKDFLENTWYSNNVLGKDFEKYIADGIFCNDRQISTSDTTNYPGNGSGVTVTKYKSAERFVSKSPVLTCTQVNDRFTQDTSNFEVETNGKLKYPVGLISLDELMVAGTYYGGVIADDYITSCNSCHLWTMTPYTFESSQLKMIYVYYGRSLSGDKPSFGFHIKPIINLKVEGVTYSGDGTMNNPFTIVTEQ